DADQRFTTALNGWRSDNPNATLSPGAADYLAYEYRNEIREQFTEVFGALEPTAFDRQTNPDAWQDWTRRRDNRAASLPARFDAHLGLMKLGADVEAAARGRDTAAFTYPDAALDRAFDELNDGASRLYANLVGTLAADGDQATRQEAEQEFRDALDRLGQRID